MESRTAWQGIFLCGVALWIVISSVFNVTQKLRSVTQPWVTRHVISGTPFILQIQKYQSAFLDVLFSGLSFVVSVPFYTAFLPFLFWSGHCKLARQMTLLIAFCDYVGNCTKDVVSAPRPSSSLVRRLTATKDEKENAMEYGLPSSHTLNTICLSGYLFYYILSYAGNDSHVVIMGLILLCLTVGLTGFGRVYLGMHSLIDIIAGFVMGLGILTLWICTSEYLDSFIVSGPNVASFWSILTLLLLFAYPTPEHPTPSFEFHTAFDGVAFGIVIGVNQTFHQFHHEDVARLFSPQLTLSAFVCRVLLGIPVIVVVKFCSKALAKWTLPILANTLGIRVRSTSYVPSLKNSVPASTKLEETKEAGYMQKSFYFSDQTWFEVDTGIRLFQYAGLAWSVVDLVPSLFSYLGL